MNFMNVTHRWGVWVSKLTVVFAVVLLAGSCGGPDDIIAERERRARAPGESVTIAAAWPWSVRYDGLYWEGIQLAVTEINLAGGVLGRTIRIRKEDDRESVDQGRVVAQRLADDPNVVAVIGHLNSHISIPAAGIYENSGLLMITPGSTSPELTRRGHRLVFRSVNSDVDIARHMVAFAAKEGHQRVVIGYVRNTYGLGLANALEEFAQHIGLEIIDRQSYDPASSANPAAYQRFVDQWDDLDFDLLFLAGMAPQAGYLIKRIRAAGLSVPILGGDALDTPELIEAAGEAAEGMVVASVFHPDDPRPGVQRFTRAFTTEFGRPPDSWAARGYEALRMLAHAMEAAGSTAPEDVARHLRSGGGETFSLSGPVRFNERGEILGRRIVGAVVRRGRLQFFDTNTDTMMAVTSLTRQDK